MNTSNIIKRTACDRCRSKRVRCPRTENSTNPSCSRCIRASAPCTTSSPGNPGRPRKARTENTKTSDSPSMNSTDFPTPGSRPGPEDNHHIYRCSPDTSFIDSSSFWAGAGDLHSFDPQLPADFISRSIHAPVKGIAYPSQTYALSSTADNLELLYKHPNAGNVSDFIGYSLEPCENSLVPDTIPSLSAAKMLLPFHDELEQCNVAIAELFSNPRNVVQDCNADASTNMENGNPVASILDLTQGLIGIIQRLKSQSQSVTSNPLSSENRVMTNTVNASNFLSSETILLIVSSYLSLMRLYESLFHGVHHCFCEVPSEAIKAIKVKGVLRIGGISSLQDLSIKSYATGIIDAIQNQIQALECCMGLPETYRLCDEMPTSKSNTNGLFSSPARRQLLQTVMEQEDVKFYRDNMSCIESLRLNIKNTVGFFGH